LETLAEELATLEERAQLASNQIREFIADMRPPRVEPDAPLVEWVRAEVDEHLARGGAPAEFELQTQETIPDLPEELRVAFIRILQEALLNTRKHAQAGRINITLALGGGTLSLVVADDGQGFSPSELRTRPPDRGGAGLQAMRARAQTLGGEFRVQTGPDQGTRVEASLPIG
jgi:signal transduction histidine kinase